MQKQEQSYQGVSQLRLMQFADTMPAGNVPWGVTLNLTRATAALTMVTIFIYQIKAFQENSDNGYVSNDFTNICAQYNVPLQCS